MRPELAPIDFSIIGLYLVFAAVAGSFFLRRAGRDIESFFVGGRQLPWWLAGTSIVATTFAADTPLAVTGIVAADGVSGNWIWWCWAIAHVCATFFFARMWRRSGVVTDAEIVELRYGGRVAAALRGFKAFYFGIFVNCLTMAWVIAAMVKISRAFFDVDPTVVIAVSMAASVAYTTMGGFRTVVVTDLVQLVLGMGGAILLAVLLVGEMGGVGAVSTANASGTGLLGRLEESVTAAGRSVGDVLDFLPRADHPTLPAAFFFALLLAGWWRHAEGYGYIVQRLAACKNEAHAQGAALWFAVAHNALRPWPWILVALAALVIYPDVPGSPRERLSFETGSNTGDTLRIEAEPASLDVATGGELTFHGLGPLCESGCRASLGGVETAIECTEEAARASFGGFAASGHHDLIVDCPGLAAPVALGAVQVELADREMAYPLLMGRTLPAGLLGLAIASLLAAFMSTIDTHTNWGASYLVQDVYRRFVRPDAPPPHYVRVSRLAIVLMAVLAGVSALFIHNIAAVWRFLINLGAGLGSVAAARWYWPRVTAYAEFAAIGVTTVLAVGLEVFATETLFGGPNPMFLVAVPAWAKIAIIAGASLAVWIPVAFWGPQNDEATLRRFAARVRPPGAAWRRYREPGGRDESLLPGVAGFAAGLAIVFGALFGIGDLILGRPFRGVTLVLVACGLLYWVIARRAPAEEALE